MNAVSTCPVNGGCEWCGGRAFKRFDRVRLSSQGKLSGIRCRATGGTVTGVIGPDAQPQYVGMISVKRDGYKLAEHYHPEMWELIP